MIAGVGTQRERFPSAVRLQAYTGIAPVTERNGGSKRVHMRYACPKFLRQTFHEWAGHSMAWSEWARVYYQQQLGRGKTHHKAVRFLAFKWQRIVFRCWQDGKPYDEQIYVAALKKRGSPVGALIGVDIEWKNVAGFSKPVASSS